jgi:uncharacterized protein GlcG (DUF336 family)
MDGCPDGAYRKFSFSKARTCIHLETSSRTFRTKYTGGNNNGEVAEPPKFTQAASMVTVMEGELIPVAGGVLIQNYVGTFVVPKKLYFMFCYVIILSYAVVSLY